MFVRIARDQTRVSGDVCVGRGQSGWAGGGGVAVQGPAGHHQGAGHHLHQIQSAGGGRGRDGGVQEVVGCLQQVHQVVPGLTVLCDGVK